VSTSEQVVDSQLQELREYAYKRGYETYREYTDHGFSGANDNRPALNALILDARKRKFDVVLVSAFDRFGRSLQFLVNTLEEFHSLRIDFISYRQQVDTTTPTGKITFAIISAMAEFERALISERVKAGMFRAAEQGKRIGRPPLEEDITREVLQMKQQGLSYRKIAERVDRTYGSVAGICYRASQKGSEKDTLEPAENKDHESKNQVSQNDYFLRQQNRKLENKKKSAEDTSAR